MESVRRGCPFYCGLDCWRNQAWLLKNSLAELPPKMCRVRMPYKRYSPISDTFLVTPLGSVFRQIEFFNSVGPGRWSGQSGKELVLAAPFLHPEMERQAMEVGRSVSGGFSDTEQQRGSKFRAQSS